MAQIFISHSSLDPDQAARLLDWLHANGFNETFLDFDKHAGLAAGSDWERSLYREMAEAEVVILVLTSNWFESKWCFAEFTQALVNEKDPARIEAIRAVDQTVELEVITVDQLNLNANRIPPSVLAEVGLVCPTCVGK